MKKIIILLSLTVSLVLGTGLFLWGKIIQGPYPVANLSYTCIKHSGRSPLELLGNGPACIQPRSTFWYLMWDGAKYYIEKPDGTTSQTWYNKAFHSFNNKWVDQLSIATVDNSSIDVIKTNSSQKSFLAGYSYGDDYKIWSWKVQVGTTKEGSNVKPTEFCLADLIEGPKGTREFAEYLKQDDNFERSLLPGIIEKGGKVIAILPASCTENECAKFDTDGFATEDFKKGFSGTDRPPCLEEGLNNNEKVHFLVEYPNGHFGVWANLAGNPSIQPAPFYEKNHLKYAGDIDKKKWLAWFQIAKAACCEEIYSDETRGLHVLKCKGGKVIEAIKFGNGGRFEYYNPIEKVYDPADKETIYNDAISGGGFASSPLKGMIEDWADDPSKARYVLAFADPTKANRTNVGSVRLAVEDAYNKSTWNNSDYLIGICTKKADNSGYEDNPSSFEIVHKAGAASSPPSWFRAFSTYEPTFLARLVILFPDAHVTGPDTRNNSLVVVLGENHHTSALTFSSFDKSPDKEYPVFKHLHEVGNRRTLARELGNALRTGNWQLSHFLKDHIHDYFTSGTPDRIRQVFPKGYADTVQLKSRLEDLVGIIRDESGIVKPIADPLKTAIASKASLNFLMENTRTREYQLYKENGTHITPPSYNRDPRMKEMLHLGNAWFSWLSMADTALQVIAYKRSTKVKAILVSSKDPLLAWSWVAGDQYDGPVERPFFDGRSQKFLLTDEPLASFVPGLGVRASAKERAYYLTKAENPGSFDLLDFIDSPFRLLMYKESNTDTKQIFRLSDNDTDAPIDVTLIDKSWTSDWSNLASLYNRPWVRQQFINDIGTSIRSPLASWFSTPRLGLARARSISVHVSDHSSPSSRFSFVPFSSIKKLADNDRGFSYKGAKLKLNTYMRACMLPYDFDNARTWRADPLGYFDRVR